MGDEKSWDARSVVSLDGTTISVITTGKGPSVIVVPGALSTSSDFASFANALSGSYRVHIVERRGRGLSGPQGNDYSMAKECEDIGALQVATGSKLIFGHSYGGLIALEAARMDNVFTKVAVYEPGVSVDGSIPLGWIDDYKRNLAAHKPLDAFAIFSVGAGPRQARHMPVWLMKLFLPRFIGAAERRQIFDLLPSNLLEHQVVGQLDGSHPRYQQITAEVLVMYGAKSELNWIEQMISALASVISSCAVQAFPRLNHFGPTKTGSREVAAAVSAFLSSHRAAPAS